MDNHWTDEQIIKAIELGEGWTTVAKEYMYKAWFNEIRVAIIECGVEEDYVEAVDEKNISAIKLIAFRSISWLIVEIEDVMKGSKWHPKYNIRKQKTLREAAIEIAFEESCRWLIHQNQLEMRNKALSNFDKEWRVDFEKQLKSFKLEAAFLHDIVINVLNFKLPTGITREITNENPRIWYMKNYAFKIAVRDADSKKKGEAHELWPPSKFDGQKGEENDDTKFSEIPSRRTIELMLLGKIPAPDWGWQIKSILAKLSKLNHKIVVVYRFFYLQKNYEIADKMEKAVQTIKNYIHDILKIIKPKK